MPNNLLITFVMRKVFYALILLLFILTSKESFAQVSGYGYYIDVTINSSQVSGSGSHTNFPVLVDITDNDLATTTNGGFVEHVNGYDIAFTDASNTATYDHQIEEYDASAGQITAWVKIPSLSTSSNTTIRLYFGNSSVTTNPSTANVWDNNYMAVWHLNESSIDDGTVNSNNGTKNDNPQLVTGKVGQAYEFDGNNDWISVPNSSSLDITGNTITLEAWVKAPVPNGDDSPFIVKGPGVNSERYMLGIDGSASSNNINTRVTTADGHYRHDEATISNNTWTHVVFVYDGNLASNQKTTYVNGAFAANQNASGNLSSSTNALQIAKRNDNRYFDGILDELRISNIARDESWIQTQYNNMNNPSGFYSLGPTTSTGGGTPPAPSTAITGYQDSCVITLDHTKVSGSSNLTDFPFYLDLTMDTLRTAANGGTVQNSNGYDIVFSNADNTEALDFELVNYNPNSGNIKAWIKVPTLSANTDTDIKIFWNKSGVSTNPSTANTWSNNYQSVWHFDDNVSDELGANNGTDNGTSSAAGLLGNSRSFNNNNDNDDYVDVGNFDVSGSAITISGWLKADDFDTDDGRILSKADGTSTNDHWFMLSTVDNSGMKLRFRLKTNGSTTTLVGNGGQLSAGTWYYANAVYDGSSMYLYLNDAQVGSTSKSGNISTNSAKDVFIGNNPPNGNNRQFDGKLDEIRISSVARSADWIATEYNNQIDPTGFYSIGCDPGGSSGGSSCGQKIDFVGTGANQQSSVTLNVSNPSNVDSIRAELVFKGGVPSSVDFQTAYESVTDNTPTYAVNGGSDKGDFSAILQPASSVTITPANNTDDVQSAMLYIYRTDATLKVNTYIDIHKVYQYRSNYSDYYKSFNINTSSVSRNIVFTIPVSELNADSREVEITVTAGSKSKTVNAFKENLGESLRLFVITLEDVPGSVATASVNVASPNSDGDSFVAGNILVDVPCDGVQGPVAMDDNATTQVDNSVDINVLSNDSDPDNNLDYSSVTVTGLTPPLNGSITNIDGATGVITYQPDPGFIGTDNFEYMVYDQTGLADVATVYVTVNTCGAGYVNSGTSGYAQSVQAFSGMTSSNADEALDAPDETSAEIYTNGDYIILDLGTSVPSGGDLFIHWKVRDGEGGTAEMNVYADNSTNPSSSQTWPTYDDNTNYTTSQITLGNDARYVKITKGDNGSSITDFDVDAVQYSFGVSCIVDSDGDGVGDINDIDDDNDGLLDVTEGQNIDPSGDADGDETLNFEDPDFAGFVDNNSDGINDNFDFDMDGIPNHLDLDSDNDGISDNIEGQPTAQYTAPVYTDTDSDGLIDTYDQDTYDGTENSDGIYPPFNADAFAFDADTDPDYLDNDADNDGAADWVEAFDTNKDGDPFPELTSLGNTFSTKSGGLNYYDNSKDDNANGIIDWMEPCGTKANDIPAFLDPTCCCYYDTDGDGVVDLIDPDNFGSEVEQPSLPEGGSDKTFRDETADSGSDPFPVELLNFEAKAKDNSVLLEWTTAAEINNDYFTLEHSANGDAFRVLTTVQGNGNKNEISNYQYIDIEATEGVNYYRLYQTDYDGTTEFLGIVSVSLDVKTISVNSWCQEADKLNVVISGTTEEPLEMQVYSITGELMEAKDLTISEGINTVQFNTSKLSQGVYLVKLTSTSKTIVLKVYLQ